MMYKSVCFQKVNVQKNYLKLSCYPALLILCFITFSCGDNKPTDQGSARGGNGVKRTQGGDSLYIHYLENIPGSEQLRKLLDGPKKEKAIFQIYRDSTGILRLIAYPSKLKNREYDKVDTIHLKRSGVVGGLLDSGSKVVFGSLQLTKANADTLRNHLYRRVPPGNTNNAGYEYIWFVPEVINNPSSDIDGYLVYHIERSSVAPAKAFTTTRLGTANPSPPRDLE